MLLFNPLVYRCILGFIHGKQYLFLWHFKVWGLSVHEELECYPKEHGRGAYLLKYGTQGVALMSLHNGQLFSCGGDGTVKLRQLSVRETIVNSKLP